MLLEHPLRIARERGSDGALDKGNLQVTYSGVDAVFRALADPVRRQLLDRLHARNGQTLRQLCAGHDMTRQAVMKHLAVLEDASLVVAEKRGREKLHYLNPVPIHEIADRWIGKYERSRLRALAPIPITGRTASTRRR
jgi:DNA-binding transcriptional ArsR family regulator